ncbi:hypothetical protein [uncultured Mucilaginibacter sp.]|uniref:hypothetical protein n=1 Tax=uncultured Mucilaginibacter sp. TaxID=797541 RepID=UPI0025F9E1D9|nr:hypothetical protein [uncultured Mucilaginibacter sp.]
MNLTISGSLDPDYFAYIDVFVFNTETYEVCKGIKAIIDTGAQDCLVKQSLAAKLGLQPVDRFKALNPEGGIVESDCYKIGLILDTENFMDTSKYAVLKMGTLEEEAFPADMILGGTFLRHCRFIYDGPGREFEVQAVL